MFSWYGDTILKMNRKVVAGIHGHSSAVRMHRPYDASRPRRPHVSGIIRYQENTAAANSGKWQKCEVSPKSGRREFRTVIDRSRPFVSNCGPLYAFDRSAHAPEDCPFPVGHFLFESKRGASYQFATAATMMLRSLGYSTRLVSGFYANPERFDVARKVTRPCIRRIRTFLVRSLCRRGHVGDAGTYAGIRSADSATRAVETDTDVRGRLRSMDASTLDVCVDHIRSCLSWHS
jgi:hypothetical protein